MLSFNTDQVQSRILANTEAAPSKTRWLLIDASAIPQVGSSAAAMLKEVHARLLERGIALGSAELHTQARELLARAGVVGLVGSEMVFDRVEDAYRSFVGVKALGERR